MRPGEAQADQAFTSYAYPVTGGPTNRTTPDRLADIVNVKDYGAIGNGVADDASAIQAAVDAAFGSAASPHGTTATSNKLLFFPNGNYNISTPIVMTKVLGARIVGAGQFAVSIGGSNGSWVTNGCQDCRFENIEFFSSGSPTGKIAFELDWDGVGSVQLRGNSFINCEFSGGDYPLRIGFSGHDGSGNSFDACDWNNAGVAGMVTWSASATRNSVRGGGNASNTSTGFWVRNGQIASISDVGLNNTGGTPVDILHESGTPIVIKGCRSETASGIFYKSTSTSALAVLQAIGFDIAGSSEFAHVAGTVGGAQAKCIIDGLSASAAQLALNTTDSAAQGEMYFRGGGVYDVSPFTSGGSPVATTQLKTGAVTIDNTGTVTWNGHGFINGNTVAFSGGSLPAQLTAGTNYFVVNAATNTFQVSATQGGSAITTSVGSGTGMSGFLRKFAGTLAQLI